jgi:hypothetical protein
VFALPSCKPTYNHEKFIESVKMLSKKEYGLDVEVKEMGKTLGIRFQVKDLLSELYSGDDAIYKKMNGLFLVLVRVALSSDIPPTFIVLDVMDQSNTRFHIVFTRYVEDVRKSMAEALSYTQNQDRLLEEFVVGEKRVPFDPSEMDLVRLMMMAMDANGDSKGVTHAFVLEDVSFPDFLAKVVANQLRRVLKEKKEVKKELLLRQVSATFDENDDKAAKGQFKIHLDLVSQPSVKATPQVMETNILPYVASEVLDLFKSYRFEGFSLVTVIEKNSGKMLTVPAK